MNEKAAVISMKTEYAKNPVGIDYKKPRLSWQLSGTKAMQTDYCIIVTASGKTVWNSGKQPSGESVGIVYDGNPLEPRTIYEWSVSVSTDDGNTVESKHATFETGLMDEGFSSAEWTLQGGDSDETNAPMFRKTFDTDGTTVRARLYMTCAGVYDAYINGQRVSDACLNPGRNEYDKHIMYQTADVTSLIREGSNVIGTVLGRGWYIGAQSGYGAVKPAFIGKLVISFADGSEKTVVTDSSWRYYTGGPVTANDIFDGETYDARLEEEGWCLPGYDDTSWKAAETTNAGKLSIGKVIAQLSGVVRPMLTIGAKAVTEPEKGRFTYDFGQNLTGVVKVRLKGKAGTCVVLRHGEMLNDADSGIRGCDDKKGTLYTTNLRSAKAIDRYILKGNTEGETYCPRFTFHGFRYVEISGIDEALPLDAVEAIVLYSDMDVTGHIETSDALINKLISNSVWGQRGNFLSVPTDCPQRDERMGWSGDAQVFCATACYRSAASTFYEKYILDLNDCQNDNGAYPDVAPRCAHPCFGGSGSNGWGDAGIVIPWVIYNKYSDIRPIEENYENMCRYIEYLKECSGSKWLKTGNSYGDWLSIGENTPTSVTDTAYCVYVCQLMSKMSEILNKKDDAEKFSSYAENFASAWRSNYMNADGSIACNTQTAYVLALRFGIIPQQLRQNAASKLVARIKENGGRISTGFLGTNFILPVLCDCGYSDVAFSLLEQKEYPSWLYPVLQGATTIWERWNSYTIEHGFGDAGMNSFNHYAYGSVAEWMYAYLAGIRCAAPGGKRISLHPHIGGSLTSVKASYECMYGLIKSEWCRQNGETVYTCTVPANTTAELVLISENGSEERHELTAGDYRFCIK